jgi:DNA polymerase Ligase (LigD)
MAKLEEYRRKLRFDRTPEPSGKESHPAHDDIFIVQKHAARRLHYDCRLAINGTLKSWAVPKGPSLSSADKRLAVQTEDHVRLCKFRGQDLRGQLRRPNGDGMGSWHVRPVERHDAGWPVRRKLASVDFIGQIALDDMARQGGRADRGAVGIDAGDAGINPTRLTAWALKWFNICGSRKCQCSLSGSKFT